MKTYEAMYVLRSAEANADWDGTLAELSGILERHGGKAVKVDKWGERKLAYDIDHQRRAVYAVIYFEAPEAAIDDIARDTRLNAKVLRVIIVVNEDNLGANVRALPAEADDRRRGGRPRRDRDDSRGGPRDSDRRRGPKREEKEKKGDAEAAKTVEADSDE